MIQPLLLFAIAAQDVVAVSTSPPPPVVVSLQSPQPAGISAAPMVAVGRIPMVGQSNEIAQVRVRIVAGPRNLLDDEFRVGRSSGASYSQSRSEAPQIDCSSVRYYGGGDRDSLNVQLNYRDEPQGGPAINVNVTWQRPTSSTTCPNEGSRSVSLVQTVPLGAGQTQTIRGDAGLTVTLSRR
jgi:hypothetical protein